MAFQVFQMSRRDRRWVSLAAGLLAVWLQILAPFSLMAGMQIGMAGSASATADAIAYLCQPMAPDHKQEDPTSKKPVRADCQICQTLHLLANGLAPASLVPHLPALPQYSYQLDGDHSPYTVVATLGFSSRAPPIL
ncbi:DUF2946 family protein [Dongia soli]|uniref:DUF2946 domain-containing protein n=1 Tax=Dongia soli TaxID=600628 RepID=A0ABU5EAJ4_9PROT|nr:DUF2946 family protein [Dongia soli]MDY0882558.1 hypothetical protein [Dongia soli]